SQTNGVADVAHALNIKGNYFYNNGNGTSGTTIVDAGVLIGLDIPNTTDFDGTGANITSGTSAQSICFEDNYVVSPRQKRALRVRAQQGISVQRNKWTNDTSDTIGFSFSGSCVDALCDANRNQNTGVIDTFESSASNKILTTRQGIYTPTLVGQTVAGACSYSARGGWYSIINGMCHVSAYVVLSALDTAGDMSAGICVTVPFTSEASSRSTAAVVPSGTTPADPSYFQLGGYLFGASNQVRLVWSRNNGAGSTGVVKTELGNTSSFHFTISYPVDFNLTP
ncbi:MAG: hypothetical protein ACREVL_14070, partial [Solimonas sp.]